jgi:hypothetical protein
MIGCPEAVLKSMNVSQGIIIAVEHVTDTNSRASFSFAESNSTQEFSKAGRVYYWKDGGR